MTDLSRRTFLKKTSAGLTAATAAGLAASTSAQGAPHAGGSDKIRVGVVGTGGRGTGACMDIAEAHPSVEIYAMYDLFHDRVMESYKRLKTGEDRGSGVNFRRGIPKEQFNVTKDRIFSDWDGFDALLDSGIDVIILATPPGFRPYHTRKAVEKGIHLFIEKPVAVDPAGVRHFMESVEMAEKKGIYILTGTQRRHDPSWKDTIARIHEGAIGDIKGGSIYWMGSELWHRGSNPRWSDMEYQCRNWYYFNWLSGDHIVEQHLHNVDVMLWVMGTLPVSAYGMGGRGNRTDPKYGNIWDHFAVEYVFPDGQRWHSMSRQIPRGQGTSRVGEFVVGTKGTSDPKGFIHGEHAWEYTGKQVRSQLQEHVNFINDLRAGKYMNEGKQVAEATMGCILGRMSAYTGRQIKWDWAWNASQLDTFPEKLAWGDHPVPDVPIAGMETLV